MIIIGKQEWESGGLIRVKNLRTREEENLKIEKLLALP